MSVKDIKISDFSTNLFWDADPNDLDFVKDANYVIKRVFTHGRIADWWLIKRIYALETIKNECLQMRFLDNKCLSLMSIITNSDGIKTAFGMPK